MEHGHAYWTEQGYDGYPWPALVPCPACGDTAVRPEGPEQDTAGWWRTRVQCQGCVFAVSVCNGRGTAEPADVPYATRAWNRIAGYGAGRYAAAANRTWHASRRYRAGPGPDIRPRRAPV